MGSSSAGVMFIMRSLVRPNTFSPTPMMISEPVTLISVMTASVRTPVSREASRVTVPSVAGLLMGGAAVRDLIDGGGLVP